jgi:hypothetical protein
MSASEKRPEFRKDLILNGLKALETLDPAVRMRILKRFPQDTLVNIYQSKDSEWLPLEYDIQLSDCMMAEVSEEEYFKFCVNTTKLSIESSLLGPFARSLLHLFQISPKSILKIAPRIWNRCYRNCGTVSVSEKTVGCIEILLSDLPSIFVESKHYLIAIVAFIYTLGQFAGAENSKVVVERQSKATRSAVIVARWDASK